MTHRRTRTGQALYLGRDTRMPTNACLDCGKVLDMAAGIGHRRKPHPGAITICVDCGHVMAFGADLKFRPLTDEEMVDIAGDEIMLAAQQARAAAKAFKP